MKFIDQELPVIGDVGPMGDGLDRPYWDGLADGRLMIQRCPNCDRWLWGPRWVCDACQTLDPEWVEIESSGRVYSWVRTWQPFASEYASLVPYVNVLVELPQAGGRRLIGLLVDTDGDPQIGDDLEAVVQPASAVTGRVPVLRWRLARDGNQPLEGVRVDSGPRRS